MVKLTIEDLGNNQCRFALGKEQDKPKYFCGKECFEKTSYCKKHFKICTKKEEKNDKLQIQDSTI
jgi:hypothetical protein